MIDIVLVKYIAGTCSSEIQKGFPETPGNPPRHAPDTHKVQQKIIRYLQYYKNSHLCSASLKANVE